MKHILYILSFALLSLFYLSCDKTPKNGALDGQWQLMEIAEKVSPTDMDYSRITNKKDERIYWAFQLDLLNIYTQSGKLNGYTAYSTARFQLANGRLRIAPTYIHFDNRDSLLTDPHTTALEPMGIEGNAADFKVETLNSKKMVLSSDKRSLTFRKF